MREDHDEKKDRLAYRYAALTTLVIVLVWLGIRAAFPEERSASEVNEDLLRDFLSVLEEGGDDISSLKQEAAPVDLESVLEQLNEEDI